MSSTKALSKSASKKKGSIEPIPNNIILGKLNGSIVSKPVESKLINEINFKSKTSEIIEIVDDPIIHSIEKEDTDLIEQLKTPDEGKKKKDKEIKEEPLKKRGRKPKEKVYGIGGINSSGINNGRTETGEIESENIIIHLPIHPKDDLSELDPKINISGDIEPEAFEEGAQFAAISEYTSEKERDKDSIMISHMEDWFNIGNNVSHSTESEYDRVLRNIKEKRDDEVENYSKTVRTTVEKCMIPMDESNKTNSWPSNSTICCWWDCHTFDGIPCALPIEMIGKKIKVFGNFCSPECAAAYNFSEPRIPGEKWERYSLLNYLYKDIYKHKIRLAPSRMTLKMFGGHLSIKEFRTITGNEDKHYNIVLPPMVSIIPVQELGNLDKGYSSKNEKKHLLTGDLEPDTGLKLKRSKPFQYTEHTLEKVMGNIIVAKSD